jgi:hypothetical protein
VAEVPDALTQARDAVDEVLEAIKREALASAGYEGTWTPERAAELMVRRIRHEDGVE